MARIWTERADPKVHTDYMSTYIYDGVPVRKPRDNLLRSKVLLVDVCRFTFQFHSPEQLDEAIRFFSRRIHPSRRRPGVTLEHYWHPWSQRLPRGLVAQSKRVRVLTALRTAKLRTRW